MIRPAYLLAAIVAALLLTLATKGPGHANRHLLRGVLRLPWQRLPAPGTDADATASGAGRDLSGRTEAAASDLSAASADRSMSHGHAQYECPICKTIWMQCRCPGPKATVAEVCKKCKQEQAVTAAERQGQTREGVISAGEF